MSRSVVAAMGVLAATLTLAGPAQAVALPFPLPFPLPFALPGSPAPALPAPLLPGLPPPAPVAADFSTPSLSPGNGEVVGVAQPIGVRFNEPIGDRAAAERAIHITTVPPVDGHFYWRSDSQVRWRPNSFWPAGTQVSVDTGGAHTSYSIGDEVIATADDATKTITVTRNGEVVRTMPTSMGKDSTPTPNGTYYVSEKLRDMYMDSSTYGVPVDSPEGYRTYVEWATRISNSGIFVHAAPWSVWAQGNTNVSHGCLNVSTEDGRWFFENSKRGDPVVVVNTVGDVLSHGDGVGDWN